MSYERKQIPAMIEVFEKAREVLWDGVTEEEPYREQFICRCIERVSTGDAQWSAVDLIERAIHPYGTLESWLASEDYGLELITDDGAMQRLRREWIDNIIADLKRFANDAA